MTADKWPLISSHYFEAIPLKWEAKLPGKGPIAESASETDREATLLHVADQISFQKFQSITAWKSSKITSASSQWVEAGPESGRHPEKGCFALGLPGPSPNRGPSNSNRRVSVDPGLSTPTQLLQTADATIPHVE